MNFFVNYSFNISHQLPTTAAFFIQHDYTHTNKYILKRVLKTPMKNSSFVHNSL